MMNISLFISVLCVLGGMSVYLGILANRGVSTQRDYFLAGGKLGLFSLSMTLLATQIGGGLILGTAEEAYRVGPSVIFYPLGMALGMAALAMGIGKRLRNLGVSTVVEIFEKCYGSPFLRKAASFLSASCLFLILIGQAIASKKFLIALGADSTAFFVGLWLVLILYTVMGGLKAVVFTDIVQTGFFILFFAAGLFYAVGDQGLQTVSLCLEPVEGESVPYTSWLLLPLMFMIIGQDMGQRCFAAKSGRAVAMSTAITALGIVLICMVPIYFGSMARELGLEITPGSSVFMESVFALTGPSLSALIAAALFMAIISTADSLLCAIGSNVAQDFGSRWAGNLWFSRFVTLAVGMAAVTLSFVFDNVVGMLMQAYELSLCCMSVPVLMAVFRKEMRSLEAYLSMVCGVATFLLWKLFDMEGGVEIPALVFSGFAYFHRNEN